MTDLSLDATQLDRYSRHVVMERVGPAGQAALLDAAVLVVGAGGLGSPALQYLAAAGVGRLGIADDDTVERSNLQRQIVHGDDDVGRPKAVSAAETVRGLNPDVTVEPHETRITPATVDLLDEYDVVVDATDNFRSRYLVNDAARLRGLPVAHGAIYEFEGQATTLVPEGPCYRCLFPSAPAPGEVPNCAETGVLGVLPGTVGSIQATEALKLVVGEGDPLVGRLLFYDAADLTTETVPYEQDPDCPVCGDDGIDSVAAVDYEGDCRV